MAFFSANISEICWSISLPPSSSSESCIPRAAFWSFFRSTQSCSSVSSNLNPRPPKPPPLLTWRIETMRAIEDYQLAVGSNDWRTADRQSIKGTGTLVNESLERIVERKWERGCLNSNELPTVRKSGKGEMTITYASSYSLRWLINTETLSYTRHSIVFSYAMTE